MPLIVEFRENGRVVYYKVISPWTMSDYFAAAAKEKAHRDATPEIVHHFVNASQVYDFPPGSVQVRNAPVFTHPRSGQVVVVGANTFARAFADMIFKFTRKHRVKFFNTEEEGWTYLRELIANESKGDTSATST
jgi:hypothetical protein